MGVSVIDCATDRVIKRFDSLANPSPIHFIPPYCSVEDKVYWSECLVRPDTIAVIACATDSIIKKLRVSVPPETLFINYCSYAPWTNRLYVSAGWGSRAQMSVYDCRTDSVIGLTQFGQYPSQILCNPVDHKIYVADYWDSAVYVFRDDIPPVEEREPTANSSRLTATIVRNVLRWEMTGDRRPMTEDWAQAFLVDVTGRKVFEVKPGDNDIRHLAPGVYFIREGSSIERKVVITK